MSGRAPTTSEEPVFLEAEVLASGRCVTVRTLRVTKQFFLSRRSVSWLRENYLAGTGEGKAVPAVVFLDICGLRVIIGDGVEKLPLYCGLDERRRDLLASRHSAVLVGLALETFPEVVL